MAISRDRDQTFVPSAEPLPQFALPEAVGVPMTQAEVAVVVQRFIDELVDGLDCARGIVLSVVTNENRVSGVAAAGYPDETIRSFTIPIADAPPIERVLSALDLQVLPDATSLPERLALHLCGPILLAPLMLGERTLALMVGQLRPDVDTGASAWRARAREVMARAALAVELQRVAAAYQEELRRRQYTREIAAATLEGRPPRDIAALVVDVVARRLRAERVGLFLRDASGIILPVALRGISSEFGDDIARLASRHPTQPRASATDLPLYVRDIRSDTQLKPEMRELMQREGVESVLVAMLQHGEEVRGALALYLDRDRLLTPLELAAFQGFADMAALGMALSQQMEQRTEVAMMEERNRLAGEIHDTVAQSLAALILQLETAQTYVSSGDRGAAGDVLASARAQARLALQETRRAVEGLAPSALATMSPAQAIAQEVKLLNEQSELTTQFILTGEEQVLTQDQQRALLRVAQEALSNARRHAQAQRVRVGLQYGSDEAILLVEDDGVGFDLQSRNAPGPEGGYGLFGMEERARLVGGSLQIDSTPGWGTRIRTILPYRPSTLVAAAPRYVDITPPAAPVQPPTVAPLTSAPLRVLIADDHAMTRQGVRAMLELSGEIVVIGEAENGLQAQDLADSLHPDVVLLDLQMPEVDGLTALRGIQTRQPGLPVIILTTFDSDEAMSEALRSGARGFLLKDAGATDLIAAVRAAAGGESVLAPSVTQRLASLASGQRAGRPTDMNERELEVLQLLARGARNKEIGSALFIAPKTVEYHLSNIFTKLGVSNRTEAARAATERGLIVPGAWPTK